MTDTEKLIQSGSKDTMPTGKQVFVMTLVLCLCAIGFIILCALDDAKMEEFGHVTVSHDASVECRIGEVSIGKQILLRDCYAFIPGESIRWWDVTVLLEDETSGESVSIPTYMVERSDMKQYFADGDETYLRVGFEANVKASKLELSTHNYKILLFYNNNDANLYIDTGYVLTKKGIER